LGRERTERDQDHARIGHQVLLVRILGESPFLIQSSNAEPLQKSTGLTLLTRDQKRFLARYWDKVDDQSQISGSSRFLSGGLGGISSQFAIYPVRSFPSFYPFECLSRLQDIS
jgi:hypothetical protein